MNERTRQYAFVAILVAGVLGLAWSRGALGREQVLLFSVLVPSVILHEISHGAVALVFGDDTAKQAGRLTLNPLAHIDPLWTIILPGLMILSGSGAVIGMAKPVPVNPRRMRRPRDHGLLTALAGPATNIVLAALATIAFRVMAPTGTTATVLLMVGFLNVVLAVFNLLPIPPLDGSSLIERVLPVKWLTPYLELRRWSFIILFALFFIFTGVFGQIIEPAIRLWERTLT